jgi:hypothetical protein
MTNVATAAGALAVGVVLAGCGHSSRPAVDPDIAGKPTWGGCQEIAGHSVDYIAGARGGRRLASAIAPYRQHGDHVVVVPRHDHVARQWLLVDDRNLIHTALGVSHTRAGWLVDSVKECQD